MDDKRKEIEFTFDKETHTYSVGNTRIPSVTEILKILSNIKYQDITESILDRAKDRGTEVHKAIELYNKFKFENIRDEYKGYFEAYKEWYKDNKIIDVDSEKKGISHIYNYAGTIDMIINKNTLVDIKTTADLDLSMTSVQCSAYEQILKENGYKIKEKYVLWLKKDGKYAYIKLKDNFNIFLSCLILYNFMEKER